MRMSCAHTCAHTCTHYMHVLAGQTLTSHPTRCGRCCLRTLKMTPNLLHGSLRGCLCSNSRVCVCLHIPACSFLLTFSICTGMVFTPIVKVVGVGYANNVRLELQFSEIIVCLFCAYSCPSMCMRKNAIYTCTHKC